MLRISDNHRFLVRDDGTPFFYLGDTAWALFQRLDRAEADRYLEVREAKGFTVIQITALSEFDGLRVPNPYGDLPLHDGDPLRPQHGYFDAYDARKAAYWALFAGAHGHTYGANGVFQFSKSGEPDRFRSRRPWNDALALPGATQMGYARRLIESRPFLERIPDPSLLSSAPRLGTDHIRATRGNDRSYAFVYSASGKPFSVDLRKLSGQTIRAAWFDPRQGTSETFGSFPTSQVREFSPPTQGRDNDWVLVLDEA
jgi:hypothetical protein